MVFYVQYPEKAMAPHSSTLAWKIPWTEEPGGLQSIGSWRVGHDWTTSLSFFTFMHWRRKWQPLQCSCLENPRDGGASWAAVYGVTQSRTRLKWLSSSSSRTGWLLDSFISTSTYISKWCLRIESQDCSADIHESTFPNSWGKNLTILQNSILDKNPEHLTNLLFSLCY